VGAVEEMGGSPPQLWKSRDIEISKSNNSFFIVISILFDMVIIYLFFFSFNRFKNIILKNGFSEIAVFSDRTVLL